MYFCGYADLSKTQKIPAMKTILVFLVSWLCIPFVFGQTMPTVTKLPEFNNPLAALPIMADQASDYVVKYQYRITGFSASIARRRVEYAKITVVNTATGVTEVSFMYLPPYPIQGFTLSTIATGFADALRYKEKK